jgi:hypothetical protein
MPFQAEKVGKDDDKGYNERVQNDDDDDFGDNDNHPWPCSVEKAAAQGKIPNQRLSAATAAAKSTTPVPKASSLSPKCY